MALTSEPLSVTLARRQDLTDQFPELAYSTPSQLAEVDAAYPDRLPTSFTQAAVSLANRAMPAAEPDYNPEEPDQAPNVTPWNSPAWQPQPSYGSSQDELAAGRAELARLRAGGAAAPEQPAFQGNGVGATLGQGARVLGQFASAPGTQALEAAGVSQEDVNALPWYVKSPLDFALNPANLGAAVLTGGGSIPAALAQGAGAGLAAGGLQQVDRGLPAPLRFGAEALAGVAGGLAGGAAFARIGGTSWMEAADKALTDTHAAEQASAPTAFQQSGALPPDLGTALGTDNGSRYVRNLAGGSDPRLLPPGAGGVLDQTAADRAAGPLNVVGGAQPAAAETAAQQSPLDALLAKAAQEKAAGGLTPETQQALLTELGNSLGAQPAGEVSAAQDAARAAAATRARTSAELAPVNLGGRVAGTEVPGPGPAEPTSAELTQGAEPFPAGAETPGLTPEQAARAVPEQPGNPFGIGIEEAQWYRDHPNTPYPGAGAAGASAGAAEGVPPPPPPPSHTPLGANEDVPPQPAAAQAKAAVNSWLNDLKSRPVQTLNNTARSTETLLDVAYPGRLAPTAGLYAPKTYASAVQQAFGVSLAADPEAAIGKAWDAFSADPQMAALNIDAPKVFAPVSEGGFGIRGAAIDPYTGEAAPGGGLGLLAPNSVGGRLIGNDNAQRLQFLQNFNQIFRPQLLREEIVNRGLTAEDLANPTVREDLGRAINLVSGHASVRPFGDESGMLFNFGNWLTAQAETILRGTTGIAQGIGNQTLNRIPGVEIPQLQASITNQAARTMVGRLAALGTLATAALNFANGISPTDARASRNGVPQVVINPTGSRLPKLPGFKDNTQLDLYGGLGEMLQHVNGIAGAVSSGFAGTNKYVKGSGVAGAAGGLADAGSFYYRSQAGWVPRTVWDLVSGKTLGGEKPTALTEAPIPFSVAGTLEAKPRAAAVQVLSSLGERFHEPPAPKAPTRAVRPSRPVRPLKR